MDEKRRDTFIVLCVVIIDNAFYEVNIIIIILIFNLYI
jgi:hypothetical protein